MFGGGPGTHEVTLAPTQPAGEATLEQLMENAYTFRPANGGKAVIDKVLAGEFEIGVAPLRHFARHRGAGLEELARVFSTPDVYVAKPGLDASIIRAFRESLVSLRDKALLGRMRRYMLHGLEPIQDSDFDPFRRLLNNEAVFFETGRWPSASGRSEALNAKGEGTPKSQ